MTRKLKQAYKEVTTAPVIEDDMMFAENGEMLLEWVSSGRLRCIIADRQWQFCRRAGGRFPWLPGYGYRQGGRTALAHCTYVYLLRTKKAGCGRFSIRVGVIFLSSKTPAETSSGKTAQPDFPPPPPFVPLNPATLQSHVPALLHAFFAARMESGLGLADDEGFDAPHTQIGMLGQIVVKQPPPLKKKPPVEEQKKVVVKKPVQSGVGKGNWSECPDILSQNDA